MITKIEDYRAHMLRRVTEMDPAGDAELALSGGVDSVTALFAMLESGRKPVCHTFYVEGVISDDLVSSRKIAAHFGLELREAVVPWDYDRLMQDLRQIIPHCAKIKKTIVQCIQPWIYICPQMTSKTIVTGLGGDDLFCSQRKVNVMLNQLGEVAVRESGWRKLYSNDLNFSTANIARYCDRKYGVKLHDIYNDPQIESWFFEQDIKDLHTPFNKAASVLAFADYYRLGSFRREHSSYQVNSKLREFHEGLRWTKHNTRGWTDPVALYHDIANRQSLMQRIVVPSIDEINAISGTNGFTAVSTFAGCGGSSTGYKWAGFKILLALEFMEKAAETYLANAKKGTILLKDDVRKVTAEQILNLIGLKRGELDLLDGSPPCQSFSNAGLKSKAWGSEHQYSAGTSQQTDDLFYEFIRLVDGIQPKVFVAENVMGLVDGVAQGYFAEIYRAMQAIKPGYRIQARKIEGARLGVPQKRTRIIFMGVREDLGRDPAYPKPMPDGQFVSVREAFEGLAAPVAGEFTHLKEGTRTRQAWDYADVMVENGCLRAAYRDKLGWGNSRYMWFKVPPHLPCATVTAKIPCLCHWDEPRTLSIHEAKRVCTFPDDFRLPGPYKDQWERIGRAVPPLMMKQIADTIAKEILT